MSGRAARLVQRATATTRRPQPARLEREAPRGYRVVAVSLYTDQAALVDGLAAQLLDGGYPKANRSLVVQEAILCLRAQLQADGAETPGGIAAWFGDRARLRRRG